MRRPPKTENDVKDLVKDWFEAHSAWHYAPIQNGLGVHGIHDRIGCVPVRITPEMVGSTIGRFVSIESKRPGRRGEENRGMTKHQFNNLKDIGLAGGVSVVCDGEDDLAVTEALLTEVLRG